MRQVKLASGKTVINLLDDDSIVSESKDENIESTSAGTLSLEMPDHCPKCGKQMIEALAGDERVYWCNSCRVTAPMTVVA